MPQTRFVLKKSLELGLRPIVVINKIDKPAADPGRTEEQVLELFLELGASEEQMDFPVVYAIGRDGVAKRKLDDESADLSPLLDLILSHVPPASSGDPSAPLRLQPFNLAYDNFLGRLAISRVYEGSVKKGDAVFVKKTDGSAGAGKITAVFTFQGLKRVETAEASVGDIVMIAGLADIYIGETVTADADTPALPAITVDEPTIALNFYPNSSPFSGREGKLVTSRQIRERLERELEVNVGLRVDFGSSDAFRVSGRGELHIAILLENMRREGYEIQVSQPQVIVREKEGVKTEPFEEIIIDAPEKYQGAVIERLGGRACVLKDLRIDQAAARMTFEGPTRGILGYRNQFIIDTKGEGIFSSRVIGFKAFAGEIRKRATGSMISMENGTALGYALWKLQERGALYIGPGTKVYEGMVIGNTVKGEEMKVNPTKGKQLTNIRAAASDEAITLVPPYELTIERGLEVMAEDEFLEITPTSVRLRKQFLTEIERMKARRG